MGQLVWLGVFHDTPCVKQDHWNVILYALAALGGLAEANAARARAGQRGAVITWGLGSTTLLLVAALVIDYAVASEGGCFS